MQRFKRWFWSVVEKMNNQERQDLVRKERERDRERERERGPSKERERDRTW